MYEDVPTSNIPNKTILNELMNENVIHPIRPKNSKNPRCLTLRGFFMSAVNNVLTMSVQCSLLLNLGRLEGL